MLQPTIPGWKVETIGDDIAWMRFGDDGRLYAINPEAGFFGVAPGTGDDDQRQRDRRRSDANCIFTNVALTDDGDVWWEGLTDEPPAHLTDWKGRDWTPGLARARRAPQRPLHRARPPSARSSRRSGRTPTGVPISAILFGGRRATRGAAGDRVLRLAARRVPRRQRRLREDRRGRGQGRRAAPRPVRDAAVLRLQHGRLLRPLAEDRRDAPTRTSCRASTTSTGSARTPTASSSGRASARTAAC